MIVRDKVCIRVLQVMFSTLLPLLPPRHYVVKGPEDTPYFGETGV